jgi:putative membrane protein
MRVKTAMAAGAIGGVAGALAMGLAHTGLAKVVGSKSRGGERDATVLAAERVLGGELEGDRAAIAGTAVHLLFGAASGAAYGAAAALLPSVRCGAGLPLGVALYFGAHGWAVPRARLSESPLDKPLAGELVEFAAHLVYGAVTDAVLRIPRR